MSVRQTIANQIKSDNPTYKVKAEIASLPDNLNGCEVRVFRTLLTPTALTLTHECNIEVLIGKPNEDDLDEALDEVLLSLQRIPGITWSNASRKIFDDKYHGYEITVSATSANIYKTLIASKGAI